MYLGIYYKFPIAQTIFKIQFLIIPTLTIGFSYSKLLFLNALIYIPEEKQKAIFAQYVSYAAAHNELGIGLGLYASKKIIEGHSGNIFVKSNINNKNTFGFKIPISQKKKTKDTVIYF